MHIRRATTAIIWLVFTLVLTLGACRQTDDGEATQLRSTVLAQETQIAGLQATRVSGLPAPTATGPSGTVVAQATQIASLAATGTALAVSPTSTATEVPTPEATATPLPPPSPELALTDLVTVTLANVGIVEDMFGKSKSLMFTIVNDSDQQVDVGFRVRFYDESGAMLRESDYDLCSDEIACLPYVAPHSQAWVNVATFGGDPLPASHRLLDFAVSAGCEMNRDSYYQTFRYGTKGDEIAYGGVALTSPEVVLDPGTGLLDRTTATLEGVLENNGDRDTSTVYVQAVGLDSDGLPIFEQTVIHWPSIPAGEKMRISEYLYSDASPSSVGGPIGDYSDIASWVYVVSSMTLDIPGSEG